MAGFIRTEENVYEGVKLHLHTAHMIPIHRSNKVEIKIHISKIHNLYLPNYTYVLHHFYHYSYCTLETKCCTLDDSEFHIVGKEA